MSNTYSYSQHVMNMVTLFVEMQFEKDEDRREEMIKEFHESADEVHSFVKQMEA